MKRRTRLVFRFDENSYESIDSLVERGVMTPEDARFWKDFASRIQPAIDPNNPNNPPRNSGLPPSARLLTP